jgi:hypothetical protein
MCRTHVPGLRLVDAIVVDDVEQPKPTTPWSR